jgi:hypothetical protein
VGRYPLEGLFAKKFFGGKTVAQRAAEQAAQRPLEKYINRRPLSQPAAPAGPLARFIRPPQRNPLPAPEPPPALPSGGGKQFYDRIEPTRRKQFYDRIPLTRKRYYDRILPE